MRNTFLGFKKQTFTTIISELLSILTHISATKLLSSLKRKRFAIASISHHEALNSNIIVKTLN